MKDSFVSGKQVKITVSFPYKDDRIKNKKRFLSKNNYLIQTDAVKNYLIPSGNYKENLEWLAYAEEADILNVAR